MRKSQQMNSVAHLAADVAKRCYEGVSGGKAFHTKIAKRYKVKKDFG